MFSSSLKYLVSDVVDDDNEDDDDDDELFFGTVDDKRCLALFPAGTFVRDPHHRESSTHREQNLNLSRT